MQCSHTHSTRFICSGSPQECLPLRHTQGREALLRCPFHHCPRFTRTNSQSCVQGPLVPYLKIQTVVLNWLGGICAVLTNVSFCINSNTDHADYKHVPNRNGTLWPFFCIVIANHPLWASPLWYFLFGKWKRCVWVRMQTKGFQFFQGLALLLHSTSY